MKPLLLPPILMAGLSLSLLTGCSSFHSEWKKSATVPPPSDEITGRWEGRWISDKNGHNGRLRCIISKADSQRYHARFHAVFWKVFRVSYAVDLDVKPPLPAPSPPPSSAAAPVSFEGDANLGWWAGGVYHYSGSATPARFTSTYRCKYDHGRFEMSRPTEGALPE